MSGIPPGAISLHAVGDIGFGGALRRLAAPEGSADPFGRVRAALGGADVLFGNLETPLVADPDHPLLPEIAPGFGGAPECARWLAAAGFTVVSLANNHVMDYGISGLRSTRRALESAGVAAAGAGETLEEARRPVVIERRGRRIGLLAYAAPGRHSASARGGGAAPLEERVVLEDVGALRRAADVVVVSAHFGLVYSDYPRAEDQRLARRLCDEGVTVLLGHHPHVLQGIERRGGGVIAYSLGEILFDPASGHVLNREAREVRRESIVLRVELMEGEPPALHVRPTLADEADLRPVPLEGREAARVLDRLAAISAPLEAAGPEGVDLAARQAGRTVSHQWEVFRHHLRKGHLGILARWLLRLRPRHLALLAGALRGRARRTGPNA